MAQYVIGKPGAEEGMESFLARGNSFEIHAWTGSGPDYLHVHHSDDEAWHVLEGTLTFRFPDGEVAAPAGTTVFVPSGVPHAYRETDGPARYLIILTPRLQELIDELHRTSFDGHGEVMRRYESEIVSSCLPGPERTGLV